MAESMRDVMVRIIAEVSGFKKGSSEVKDGFDSMKRKAKESSDSSKRSIKEMAEEFKNVKSQISQATGGFNSLMGVIKGAATLYGGKKIFDFLTAGNMQFEEFEMSFEVILKSADKAKEKMEYLWDFAAKTPYELPQVTQASLLLETFGLRSEEYLKQAGDLAAAFKATGASITEVANAFGRIKSGQYGEAFEALRRWGISQEKLAAQGLKFSSSNEYVEKDAQKALTAVRNIVDKEFGGMMDKLSKTISGRLSTMKDEFASIGRDLGKDITEDYGKMIDRITMFLRDMSKKPEFMRLKNDLGDIAGDIGDIIIKSLDMLIKGMGWVARNWDTTKSIIKTALGLFLAFKGITTIVSIVNQLQGAFMATKTAIDLANASASFLMANPAIAAIALIVGGLTALTIWTNNQRNAQINMVRDNLSLLESYEQSALAMNDNINKADELINKQKTLRGEIETLKSQYDNSSGSIKGQSDAITKLASKQVEYINASKELNNVLPQSNSLQDENAKKVDTLNSKQNELIASIENIKRSLEDKNISQERAKQLSEELASKQSELKNTTLELAGALPEVTGALNDQGQAMDVNISKNATLRDEMIKTARLQYELAKTQAKKNMDQLQTKYDDLTAQQKRVLEEEQGKDTDVVLNPFGQGGAKTYSQHQESYEGVLGPVNKWIDETFGSKSQKQVASDYGYRENIGQLDKDITDATAGLAKAKNLVESNSMEDYFDKLYGENKKSSSTPEPTTFGKPAPKTGSGKTLFQKLNEKYDQQENFSKLANELQIQEYQKRGYDEKSPEIVKLTIDGLKQQKDLFLRQAAELSANMKNFKPEEQGKAQIQILELQKQANEALIKIQENTMNLDFISEKYGKLVEEEKLKNDIALQQIELNRGGADSLQYTDTKKSGLYSVLGLINKQKSEVEAEIKNLKGEPLQKAQIKQLELQKEANDLLLQIQNNTKKIGEFNLPSDVKTLTLAEYKMQQNPNSSKGITIANAQIVLDIKEIPKSQDDILGIEDLLAQRLQNIVMRGI